jgi:ectoine hydroxylase-related dioxygenase (phytanoyl-CoA dioxygenase family)
MVLNEDLHRFAEVGYAVIPGLLSRQEAEELRAAFDGFPEVRRIRGGAIARHNERTLLRDERFFHALMKPALIDAVRGVLGDELQLIAYDSADTLPHSGTHRNWHADMSFWTDAVLTVNVGIYLQDMTPEMGPLALLPGSHRWRRNPTEEEAAVEYAGEVEGRVPAGTAIMFDAKLWHSAGRNDSDRHRRALFPYFGHYWIKRAAELYPRELPPLPEYITTRSDPLTRQLFGLGLRECVVSTL